MTKQTVAWTVRSLISLVRCLRCAPLAMVAALGCLRWRWRGWHESDSPRHPHALDAQVRALAVTRLGLTGDPASRAALLAPFPASDPHGQARRAAVLFADACRPATTCPVAPATIRTSAAAMACPCRWAWCPAIPAPLDRGARWIRPGTWIRPPTVARTWPATASPRSMPRCSIATQMYDGRVFVLDEATVSGGHGQLIRTPESGQAL